MFCSETLGPGSHVGITLTTTTYINIATNQAHRATTVTNKTMQPATQQKNYLENLSGSTTKNTGLEPSIWTPYSLIQTSIQTRAGTKLKMDG